VRQTFTIERRNPRWRDVLDRCVAAIREAAEAGDVLVKLGEIVRTLDQNAAMWPALTDITAQVPLVITSRSGATRKATAYDWKDVLTAAFEEETEWAPGLRGGVVMLGARTSKYGKRKMADFLSFVHAEGSERGVMWSDRSADKFDEYGVNRARVLH
jgi:hypothetical protein